MLGKPSTNFKNSGFDPATGRVKLVEPAWNVGLNDEKLITTLNTGEYVTVKFDHQVEDDPLNPYGIDLLVFGNPFYVGSGFVSDLSNMEDYMLVGGAWFEQLVVSVSQDGEEWYTYDSGPYCDSAFPTQAYLWDSENEQWTDTESDFTKPVDPDLADTLLAGGMSAADAIALYDGSGGGTGFDLAESGYDWIQYVRVEGIEGFSGGEVDAFADVAPVPVPAAVWLLGSGLLGVVGLRRRRK
ncbi:VPLPA-CTERM sorting domain-containing protein [Desulfosarcina cetonica]|uniref:VPLPA-CTERM sorting domain-containing protein n=1 Tax=Desulfosarcina cetonica TaxID=90730 RepID=UPI0006D233BF|nr:VPLPA-CTERM sorting domain-containing protein [Desulfosarcina cetonica]